MGTLLSTDFVKHSERLGLSFGIAQALQKEVAKLRRGGSMKADPNTYPPRRVRPPNRDEDATSEAGSFELLYDDPKWLMQDCNGSVDPSSLSDSFSWFSGEAQNRCFMSDAMIRYVVGDSTNTILATIGSLTKRSVVRGYFSDLEVREINVMERECVLVDLEAVDGATRLTVTDTHRIVTGIDGRRSQTRPAGELKQGDYILSTTGPQLLRSVSKRTCTAIIVEVTFYPDEPVEVFDAPNSILSKGQAKPRRGNATRRQAVNAEISSIPDTEYSWPSARVHATDTAP